jgi:predicted nucleotidyltransferase
MRGPDAKQVKGSYMLSPDVRRAVTDARAIAIIHGIVSLFEIVFPDRVRGYYLLGSYSEGTTVTLSDIDLMILFRGAFQAGEEETINRVIEACGLLSPVRLDIMVQSEAALRIEDVRLKLGSMVVAGEDTRAQIPLPTPEAHARYITEWANYFIRLLHDDASLSAPLSYPDAADEFYGYARIRIPQWYPPEATAGTKELVATVCWTANALLSLTLGVAGYVGTKGAAVERYGDVGAPEWRAYVTQVYTRCKGAWRYDVPQEEAQRAELRELCAQSLAFFQHYQATYQDYLRAQQ